MATESVKPVVAAFDGSNAARLAAYWAAREADSRSRPLRLVQVVRWPLSELSGFDRPIDERLETEFRDEAARQLDLVTEHCAQLTTGLAIDSHVLTGEPVSVLSYLAREANLLVLGSSGHSDIGRVLVGSSSAELARHAPCPVVVVRGLTSLPTDEHDFRPRQRVVVGVDGSAASTAAVRFAVDFVLRHTAVLVVVHAWCDLPIAALPATLLTTVDPARMTKLSESVLADVMADHQRRHPALDVRPVVATDRPAQALLAEGQDAALIVVGDHGRGRASLPLGSVSHAVLHYATCPVAIVR